MTALRELAEAVLAWWKDHEYDAYPDYDGDDRNAYDDTPEFVKVAQSTILDAEGDGGAVDRDVLAVGVRARNIEITRQQRAGESNNEDHALRIGIAAALATHPARSGVVRDEDVEAACGVFLDNVTDHQKDIEVDMVAMRAALEHFAKGSSEDVLDAPELFSGTKDALSNLSIHKSYQEKTS